PARLLTSASRDGWCSGRHGRHCRLSVVARRASQYAEAKTRGSHRFLRDHLTGADTAIRVVHRLGATRQDTEARTFFRRLSKELDEERSVVCKLLTDVGASVRSLKRTAGFASGTVLSATAGGEPGDLSLLQTLEALSIGVQ